ncbi:MAG: lipoate--protein ligase family protein [Lachnospiraceae bacterium]|nr:lipoate--protein ligase family protein [Lachnospiraceae bacterium]
MYKYICSENTSPYYNLALERSLFDFVDEDTVILYLWQNSHTIVIGKNQNAYAECKVDEFIKDGGTLARRPSGGGAVYHDLGNLNFSIICNESIAKEHTYQRIVKEALGYFDIVSEFNGRNDLTVDDKKFSGNAFYVKDDVLCQHGTILINSDFKELSKYLTPDISKLERNHVKSVESRVVNLSEISDKITVESMKEAMIKATNAVRLGKVTTESKVKEYKKIFENDEWILEGKIN